MGPLGPPAAEAQQRHSSVSVELAAGEAVRFKYLTADGCWLTDPDADRVAHNEFGTLDSLLHA